MKSRTVDKAKKLSEKIVERFKESKFYWIFWGDDLYESKREESRQLRYGKADKRTD
ncbi:hypothetical protein [Pseudomonas reactans]|uniref:hypothetical protein n=1 Tax=Pseudomonas reactans TaxID=117680 RepID=UPI0015A28ACA|nr:hypothetical protein [Pseudomonas reactans]NWC90016.1 hypothetical protein [Pseudomonas reactans]